MPKDVVDDFGGKRIVWISGRFGYRVQPCYSPAGKFVYYIVEKVGKTYIEHSIPYGEEEKARARAMELGGGSDVVRPISVNPLGACIEHAGYYSGVKFNR